MRRLLSVGSLCLLVVGCYAPEASEEATSENRVLGRFEVAVLDVGQGSAAVVAAPGGCVALLDGGPEGSGPVIKRYLRSLGVTEIAFAVASHYHEDHIGGLDEVEQGADGLRIRTVYDRGGTFQGAAFGRYYRQFADRRATVHAGQTLSLCGEVALEVEAVDAGGRETTDENARSVVVAARWRAIDVLAGGDLPGAPGTLNMEAQLAPALGPVEAYLVHHHGSRSSSSTELLRAITPQVSIISVGADNTYNHPAPETLARLREAASDVWQTEDPATQTRGGHVRLASLDGASFTVAQGARRTAYRARDDGGACATAITYRAYFNASRTLRLYATSTRSPDAALSVSADGVALGAMTWSAANSRYELVQTLAARPRCVTVHPDCGEAVTRCY